MKKFTIIILAFICIIGLMGCNKNYIIKKGTSKSSSINTHENKATTVTNTQSKISLKAQSKLITNLSKKNTIAKIKSNSNKTKKETKKNLTFNLINENKIIKVKNENDISTALCNTIKSKNSIVNFDISNYDNVDKYNLDIYKNTSDVITNIYYSIQSNYPELNIVQTIDSFLNKGKKIITVRIYYYYFKKNNDIFIDNNHNCITAILNKRVIKQTDKTKISLLNLDFNKYTVQYIPYDNTIISIDKSGNITPLKEG